MKLKRLEKDVQRAICEYLKAKGYFFWRQNTAPTYQKDRRCYRSMPAFALKGVSDIILLKDGIAYFIEVKSTTGRQSAEQREFETMVTLNGGVYILARSVDDVMGGGL